MNAFAKWREKCRPESHLYVSVALFCLAALTFLPQLASAQMRSQPSTADPTKTYTITGSVINAITGDFISRALVQLAGGQAIMTADDGGFEFNDVLWGPAHLTARKPGFFTDDELHPGRQLMFIRTDEVKNPVVIKLTPQSVITGRITDSSGEPLENLPVALAFRSIQDGSPKWMSNNQTTTNEDGEFRLPGLRPGQYLLSAGPLLRPSSFGEQADVHASGYARTYYAGVSARADATPISIAPGQHAEFDFSLELVPMYQVAGSVSGAPPNVGMGWHIVNRDGDDSLSGISFDPANSAFRSTLPRGLFTIKTFAYVPNKEPLRAEATVNVSNDVNNVVLALQPSTSIPIHIRYERTKTDGSSPSQEIRPNIYLRFVPEDPFRNEYFSEIPQNQPPQVTNIDPGDYWVRVENAFPGYVQSLRCGSQDLTREKLTVTAGQHSQPIEVVLRDDAATLNVSIRSDDPTKERPAVFALSGAGNPQIALRMAMSWTSGTNGISSELNDLAPGDYTVYAFDDAASLEYRNPDVLSAYSSHAAHVTLAPNGKTNVTVDLIHVED